MPAPAEGPAQGWAAQAVYGGLGPREDHRALCAIVATTPYWPGKGRCSGRRDRPAPGVVRDSCYDSVRRA